MRYDWDLEELQEIYHTPLLELIHRAAITHRNYHKGSEVQLCQLISIKTGGCPEDCKYCAQSSRYNTSIKAGGLMAKEEVISLASRAKERGATRVCLGAAWREVRDSRQFDQVLEMVQSVCGMGMEVCCTLGMLSRNQAKRLKEAGLYAYNHNLDSSEKFYETVISTRKFNDRLKTHEHVRDADISLCSGGIIGMGESEDDRLKLLQTLALKHPHPESVPINRLVPIAGTPLEESEGATAWELIRTIATARIVMPQSMVRLSAGRETLSIPEQGLCFLAGANSIFVGDKLLTAPNTEESQDLQMMKTLGLKGRPPHKQAAPKQSMAERLVERREQASFRTLSSSEGLIDLTSNDYLGFARSLNLSEQVETEYCRLVHEEGIRPHIGATGSRLLTGNHSYAELLEKKICAFHGAEAGLLFNSGYLANLGLLSAVAREGDTLIFDAQVHASTWDGARLSDATQMVFRHNDLSSLERQLKKASRRGGEMFVCIESLYSMSGDIAPVEAISALCMRYDAKLIVDEAHASGILGPEGRGLAPKNVFARMHTFGKALGTHGAIVMGSSMLKEYLLNFSRPLIYTTAFPLHTLVTIDAVYNRLANSEKDRRRLQSLIRYFQLQVEGLPIETTDTPIQSIVISGNDKVVAASEMLRGKGLDVRPIRSPTVRKGKERLRVCLHTFNTKPDIDLLIEALSPHLLESSVA